MKCCQIEYDGRDRPNVRLFQSLNIIIRVRETWIDENERKMLLSFRSPLPPGSLVADDPQSALDIRANFEETREKSIFLSPREALY